MAEYDLFPRFVRYLDPQLAFGLLEYVRERHIYDPKDVARAQVQLVHHTNMVQFEESIYSEELGEEPPEELAERKQTVLQKLQQAQEAAQPLIDLLSKEDTIVRLRQDRAQNIATLKNEFGVLPEHIEGLFKYGKEVYECGAYQEALSLLTQFETYSLDAGRIVSADWGKLACEILMQNWSNAAEIIDRLKEEIDAHLFAHPLKQLQSRTWLLHWATFVYWSMPDGPSKLLDMMLQEKFAVALQLNAPHLLRYVVAAHLVVKGKYESQGIKWQVQLDQLRRVLVSEAYQYSDPVTDFVKAVYVDYDFDRAQEQLQKCDALMSNDYFLQNMKADFQENARMAIFEVYCRIHQCINLSALAKQMGMAREEAEGWIAQLIRVSKLDARIDSSAGNMVMGTQYVDPLDAVVERTNNLSTRTFKVANAIIDGMQPAKAAA